MILVIKCNVIGGEWNAVEGTQVGDDGSTVTIMHKGKKIGTGEVVGFKHSNKANQPMSRFARNVEARR